MNFTPYLEHIIIKNQEFELFVPDPKEVHDAYIQLAIEFPFWAQVWPSSKALATFILDHPAYLENKRVLELGAGLGLPSLVAARWATSVISSDHDPSAIEFARMSVQYHRLKNVTTRLINWNQLPADLTPDVVLLSDVNYDPASFEKQQAFILSFLQKNITIILSTPQRLLARPFLLPLMNYCRHNEEFIIKKEDKEVIVSVMVLAM
ncbi:MAG TPA: methyltransferase domain-containing protein [Flavisolibacter sp.]|nr:methyltransferase domain-containing protein [Flavisolibacter sp.]